LLAFAERHTGKPPSRLDVADLDAPLISAFLEHLQAERANSTQTRNARLAAVHSLFRFAA
jgi:integrase/recombinase XerD